MTDFLSFAAIFTASAYAAALVHTVIGNTNYGFEFFSALAYAALFAALFAVSLAICCIVLRCLT